MRSLRLLILLALAAAAAVLNLSGVLPRQNSDQSLFQQGAFRLLVSADQFADANLLGDALRAWRVVQLRAHREPFPEIAGRVRLRIAWEGRNHWPDERKSWPFMVWYALSSYDFNLASAQVEAYVLSCPHPPTRFQYCLTEDSGNRTAWGVAAVRAPLWLYRHLPADFALGRVPGILYNHTPLELPRTEQWSWGLNYSLPLKPGHVSTTLCVENLGQNTGTWWVSLENLVLWKSPVKLTPDTSQCIPTPIPRYLYLDRILVTGERPAPRFRAALVHEYQPLEFKDS
jgi:hypothetical protein